MGWDDRFDEISGDTVGCLVGVLWTRRYSQGTEYSLDVGASCLRSSHCVELGTLSCLASAWKGAIGSRGRLMRANLDPARPAPEAARSRFAVSSSLLRHDPYALLASREQ